MLSITVRLQLHSRCGSLAYWWVLAHLQMRFWDRRPSGASGESDQCQIMMENSVHFTLILLYTIWFYC